MAVKTAPPPRHVQSHFLNRELGLLEFQRRVLAQAEDSSVPLLERLKFLCIVSSNLDEFFEIRVSGVKEQIKMNIPGAGPDGKTPREVFQAISRIAHDLVARQYRLLNDAILPDLERVPDLVLDDAAHLEHLRPDRLELGVEVLGGMRGGLHGWAPGRIGRNLTSVGAEDDNAV